MGRLQRRFRHEQQSAEFDLNRGREGQMHVRRNEDGEIELVAFFGGKWFYVPMAEFNQNLNLRRGATIDGDDIMTASQINTPGFRQIRIDTTSPNTAAVLNEVVMFVDTCPATAEVTIANCNAARGAHTITCDANTSLKIGLNVRGAMVDGGSYGSYGRGAFITALTAGNADDGYTEFDISRATASAGTDTTEYAKTYDASYPNAFLNIVYKDGSSAHNFYHKFQLNHPLNSPFIGGFDPSPLGTVTVETNQTSGGGGIAATEGSSGGSGSQSRLPGP